MRASSDEAADLRVEQLLAGVEERDRTFDAALAVQAGAAPADVVDFALGFLAGGGAVQNVVVPADRLAALRAAMPTTRSCAGRNSADVTGLQANLYLNSCNATKISSALAVGAGVATLVGIITSATGAGGIAGGIAAALLGIGSGAIAYCNSRGRGIGFHALPVGAPWCASQ